MLGFDENSFSADQRFSCVVETWNTPFTASTPSGGLRLDSRQPNGVDKWTAYLAALKATDASSLNATFNSASTGLVSDGRVPNLFDDWGAGAPAWYGAGVNGQIALHYSGQLRAGAARGWFSSTDTVTLSFGVAGSGYMRITKTVSGVTSDVVLNGSVGSQLAEQDYLDNGPQFTEVLTLSPGDAIDVYYVQNSEPIGGLVVKALLGGTEAQTLDAYRTAPVVGCGVFDDGNAPAVQPLPNLDTATVSYKEGSAFTATVQVPLINPLEHDGFGYEYKRNDSDQDDEYLNVWDGGQVVYALRKGRLLRISLGAPGTAFATFTGILKDFSNVSNGQLALECLSFEHRLLETHTKNEPSELSYMAAGYMRTSGTSEPVYGIPAYDNWTMEAALTDLLVRAGIDAGRLRTPLSVSKSDGSTVPVSYAGQAFTTFRARNVLGKPLKLERPVHYGNVGGAFTDVFPVDDAYLFSPENLDTLWKRCLSLTDRYGYDFRFSATGDVVLSFALMVDRGHEAQGLLLEFRHPIGVEIPALDFDALIHGGLEALERLLTRHGCDGGAQGCFRLAFDECARIQHGVLRPARRQLTRKIGRGGCIASA